jgi:hypothetical protein
MDHLRVSAHNSLNRLMKYKIIDFVLDMFNYTNLTLRRKVLTTRANLLSETMESHLYFY